VNKTLDTLAEFDQLIVAYSGGLDSSVLLHLVRNANVLAVHFHHGLNKNADQWQQHCQRVCDDYGIALECIRLNLSSDSKQSLEAQARDARYEILSSMATSNKTAVLTAHHADDQAETLLLQLLRGAGVKGLAAMPGEKSLGQGVLLRPLLNLTREQLQEYAQSHQLNWINDDSNTDLQFDRNYLRQKIIPELQQRWPSLSKTLTRSTEHCAEADSLLTELAVLDYQTSQSENKTLKISALKQLSPARQRNLLRYWLQQLKLPLPSQVYLKRIQYEVLTARQDAMPLVQWPGCEIRRYRDQIYAMLPLQTIPKEWCLTWDGVTPLQLPYDLGELKPISQNKQPYTIRLRQGGERYQAPGKTQHTALKKLFQTWNIPAWQRGRVPLVFLGNELVYVKHW